MSGIAPVLAAGGTFAATTLVGLLAGVWIGRATGQPLWVIGGLFAGLAVGGYSAFRLLLRSL
ncbi:MAG: AtpZ/AtpI family protein [Candidatus Tumulicola sp.]